MLLFRPVIPPYENAPAKKIAPFSLSFTGVGMLPWAAMGNFPTANATLATAGGEKSSLARRSRAIWSASLIGFPRVSSVVTCLTAVLPRTLRSGASGSMGSPSYLISSFLSSSEVGKTLLVVRKFPSEVTTTQPLSLSSEGLLVRAATVMECHAPRLHDLCTTCTCVLYGIIGLVFMCRDFRAMFWSTKPDNLAANGHSSAGALPCSRNTLVLALTLPIKPSTLPFDWCSSANAKVFTIECWLQNPFKPLFRYSLPRSV